MTYQEALKNGYKDAFRSYARGYVSRKIDPMNQPCYEGKGYRKGLLFVKLPCFNSTRYFIRQYLVKG